ncbi:hypothetical protein P152DRAFT_2009 [Eremomyces bilateralis CBS 781.70]|uniref:Uncharacterized protein n=1 Tax=Eremomyces bilateralis CBS 781.70 TaxID=1392243 RepID=A0A6G1GG03_9PEZI|nr:uncharacterized protein P152DRAFT_2009 [Eremomyces bilateralis CBS 781.70]KAF1816841.1 hypothetical protein P152DRAFT_2009 [Eremomyces bilateralis CBS 781.70]
MMTVVPLDRLPGHHSRHVPCIKINDDMGLRCGPSSPHPEQPKLRVLSHVNTHARFAVTLVDSCSINPFAWALHTWVKITEWTANKRILTRGTAAGTSYHHPGTSCSSSLRLSFNFEAKATINSLHHQLAGPFRRSSPKQFGLDPSFAKLEQPWSEECRRCILSLPPKKEKDGERRIFDVTAGVIPWFRSPWRTTIWHNFPTSKSLASTSSL